MAEHASYVYAVARASGADEVPGVTGVGHGTVRIVSRGGLAAAVSTVPLDEFGEQALRRNLEDLGWVENVARAHDRVVTAFAALAGDAPVAPLRLATIYLDDERVGALLDEKRDVIERALDRLAGRVEWGVKAYADAEAAAAAVPSGGGGDGEAESGTAYLSRRRAEVTRREELARQAAETGEQAHVRLSGVTVASRRHAAQDPRLSGHRGEMVLNGAYLVDRAGSAEVEATVEALRAEHPRVRFELTGPWPPYSFAQLDEP